MSILVKLFLEAVIKRKPNSWDVRTIESIVLEATTSHDANGDSPREHDVLLLIIILC